MVFSVGCVFAEEVNSTDLENGLGEISSPEVKSFTDLNNLVHESDDTNLTADYAYDKEKDNISEISLKLNGSEHTINGNNHVIDAKGAKAVFGFRDGTVTINNLVFKNCAGHSIVLVNCTLITNNVTFEDNVCNDYGAVVIGGNSQYFSNADKFINNYAKTGAAVFLQGGSAQFDKSIFKNDKPIHWSLIYGAGADITVLNSIFNNISSRYATVVYSDNAAVRVYNSKFTNLYANATGGAIAVKNSSVIIERCEFENVSSRSNGGALYLDINSEDSDYSDKRVLINNTLFTNCSSGFGGAILELGGYLNIIFSEFIKNYAVYGGGAVYTSNASLFAYKSIFNGNSVQDQSTMFQSGGALYIDYTNIAEIETCDFVNNSACEGGAIFTYDSKFNVSDCEFNNNGEALRAYFANKGSVYENCSIILANPDKFILNSTYYPSIIDFGGAQIVLNPIEINGSVEDTYFNLKDFNAITPVKDQGSNGACWAFGANGALESAFLKATGIALDLSENNIQSAGIRYSIYGRPSLTEGGYIFSGMNYYLAWLGAIDTKYDTYDELGKISNIYFTPDSYHILDAVFVDVTNITAVKEALVKYGALTIFVTGATPNTPYYNPVTYASYCDNGSMRNHFVTLVGWNDTFSKDNFVITPNEDGAWICKNSWGTEYGDKGFYYLSYYDAPLRASAVGIAYAIENTVIYNKLYQYDISGFYEFSDGGPKLSYINNFESAGNDFIAAVGTFFEDAGVSYTIKIHVNGVELYSQSGKSLREGYETIKLNKYVCISEGDKFSVEMVVSDGKVPLCRDNRLFFEEESSMVRTSEGLEDLSGVGIVACLKAYTLEDMNVTCDVVRYCDPNKVEFESALEGAKISIYQKSKLIASTTVKNGKATFNVKINPGDYSIITSYNNTDIVNSLKMLASLDFTSHYTLTMDYNAGASAKVKVVNSLGKPLSGKTVSFVIKGKTYKRQTDSKGIATFKIPNAVTPGTYKLVAKYNGFTVSKTVKVKQILKSSSTVTVKKSAKKLTLQATLKSSAGKAIKSKKVSFKVNGKTLSAKTNSKGVVKVTYNKAFINKLKAGKSYKIQITYLKDTIKTTLKVKR